MNRISLFRRSPIRLGVTFALAGAFFVASLIAGINTDPGPKQAIAQGSGGNGGGGEASFWWVGTRC